MPSANLIFRFFRILTKIFCCCFTFFSKRTQRTQNIAKIRSKIYKLGILKFFTYLIFVLRAVRKLRDRTIFRTTEKLKEFDYYLINDVSYISNYEHQSALTEFFNRSCFSFCFKFILRKMSKKLKKTLRNIIKKIFEIICKNLNFFLG